jgi:hypothetical protein
LISSYPVPSEPGKDNFSATDVQFHRSTNKVLEAIKGTGGTALRTSLDHTKEQALRDALAASPGFGASPEAGRRRPYQVATNK